MVEKDTAFADEEEEEAEQTFTIEEYLDGVEADEMEADLVLGGDEGKECTYTKGYLKRQAIFSCLTCTPDGNAGVCTGCSLSCHDGHEVVELWTKRNFRCDCGNSKFGEFFCKLFPGKDAENVENSFNHNFKGFYCTCARPYPDPDTEEQIDMIQCCICEDWFHEEHIGLESADEIPRDEEGEPHYEDFICQACSSSCSFLTLYPKSVLAAGAHYSSTEDPSKDKTVPKDNSLACASGKLSNENSDSGFSIKNHVAAEGTSESVTGVKNLQPSDFPAKDVASTDISSNGICILGVHVEVNFPSLGVSKPMFLSKSWRDALCKCMRCMELYRQNKVSFLVDREDSIVEYLKMAKQRREDKLQQEESANLNLFNNLGHVEKIEILNGIEQIKDGLLAFMESSDPSKPVTPADIHDIFENLAKRRRRG